MPEGSALLGSNVVCTVSRDDKCHMHAFCTMKTIYLNTCMASYGLMRVGLWHKWGASTHIQTLQCHNGVSVALHASCSNMQISADHIPLLQILRTASILSKLTLLSFCALACRWQPK